MKQFGGSVLFLDRSDINTDEIIPVKYLTDNSKQALKPYLFEDLKLDGFNSKTDVAGKRVIITRENFGCGAVREHAPIALEANSIHTVVSHISVIWGMPSHIWGGRICHSELSKTLSSTVTARESLRELTFPKKHHT